MRRLDGFVQVTETNTQDTDRAELSNTIPMLYGHVRFDLPFTGLAAGIRGNGIGFKESNLLDLEAYLHLEVDLLPAVDFGIQGGLRRISMEIEDLEEWNSDATLEGATSGLPRISSGVKRQLFWYQNRVSGWLGPGDDPVSGLTELPELNRLKRSRVPRVRFVQ